MVKYLLKKSYQRKDLKSKLNDLWNDNGVLQQCGYMENLQKFYFLNHI